MQNVYVLSELGVGTEGLLQGWVRMIEVVSCLLVIAQYFSEVRCFVLFCFCLQFGLDCGVSK